MESKICYEHIDRYIRNVISRETGFLKELEEYARLNHIPIIQPETAAFLKVLIKIHKPGRILEAGTAIGYSSIVMAEANPETVIDTIEIDEEIAKIAEKNIRKMGLEENIRIIIGDALEVMQCLSTSFDMIFLDSAKGQYIEYLPEVLRLLKPGGLLVSDNILYKGLVAEPGPIPHKHRTIANNLRKYINLICNDKKLETSIIPIGDGLAVSIKER
ncbi:MAG: O-methyltransferase [Clostridiaceae bacterium]|nr:O-methyltransferase [Clostridiaceae bacterium]